MKKRILVLFLVLTMIIPSFGLTAFGETGLKDLTIADLSKSSAISKTGFPASNVHTKSGSFTLKWAGSDIYKNIALPLGETDFSPYEYLKLDIYSTKNTGSSFTLCLMSENGETASDDYYTAKINVNWTGWKTLSLKLKGEDGAFKENGTPLGMDSVTEIKLLPLYGNNTPKEDTELYLDRIYLSSYTDEEEDTGKNDLGNAYILVDASSPSTYASLGLKTSEEIKGNAECTIELTGDKIKNGFNFSKFPKDWSSYKSLVLEIYIANPTDSVMRPAILSDNPETAGDDYYMTTISCSNPGWQTVVLPFINFNKTRTPIGWDNITAFAFWNTFSGVSVDPETLIYIDRIYLSESDGLEIDNSVDLLIESQPGKDFEDIISALKTKNPGNSHPRLLFNKEELKLIKELSLTDKFAKDAKEATLKSADAILNMDVQPYGFPDGKRLERTTPDRIPTLAMAYLLTGDEKYKDRLWLDVENICSYPNWNPSHFLDVGDFARGMAYAYDWLYDEWTDEEKRIMRNGFVRNAFTPSINYLRTKTGFAGQSNNWCEVINSGLGLAALAIGDEAGYENMCNEILNLTVDSLPNGLSYFGPDGACAEGPGYWRYAMQTFLQYNKSMFTSLGTDYGLSDMPGISNTGYFPISTLGPTNETFNYGDAGSQKVTDPCLFWLGERFGKKEFISYVKAMRTGESALDLAFYRGGDDGVVFSENMKRDDIFRGVQEVGVFRSSWNDNNSLFVAFKGGSNAAGHNDLDLGDFVLDAQGVRWFSELGAEYYEAPGMWDVGPDGGRWKYYRKNTEGQNTILINPSDKPGQDVYSIAPISEYKTSDSASFGIIDLTDAYKEHADSVKRGVGLVNNRSSVIIQDEIKAKENSEIYTFYHTTADISIEDDGKTAILTQYGKQLRCTLASPSGAKFEILDAEPLPTSADPGYTQYSNKDKKKLTVHLENTKNATITVLFTPYVPSYPEGSLSRIINLDKWNEYLNSSPSITDLTVDSVRLSGFSPSNTFYTIDTGIVGRLNAVEGENTRLEFIQAEKLGDTAFAVATSEATGLKTIYSVSFTESEPDLNTLSIELYPIKEAKASAVPEPVNVPENTFDGKYNTKWAAEGEQWIMWDLGEEREISSVMLAFGSGDTRIAKFDLSLSKDGESFDTVYSGTTTKKTSGLEEFTFQKTKARYIRLDSHGNNVNSWISLSLIKVPKIKEEFTDITSHWAKAQIMDMARYGFIKGVTETEFAPENSITRAEFITIASRLCSFENYEFEPIFADVSANDYFASSIIGAYKNGLIADEMITDNCINPNAYITREEMASVIVRAYERFFESPHGDMDFGAIKDTDAISEFAKNDIKKALSLRFVKGVTETEFMPKANATRAQAAVMLKRLFTKLY